MAAATNAIRTYLKDVIGLGNDQLGTDRANAIIGEGLDNFDALVDFNKDDIKSLCYTVRKPGGLMEDPNNNARQISNPGTSIPAIAESRLQVCAYGARIYKRLGREINATTLSKNRLTEFKYHKETVDNCDDPDSMPPISKTFGIMKMLEHFPTYLESKLGTSGVALAYVIRPDAQAPVPLPNQAHGKPWSGVHEGLVEELIAYAEHAGPTFKTDSATVYRLLQDALAGTQHSSSIKPFQGRRDGRGAFEALMLHNLGNSKWEKVVEVAETYVNTRTWDGRNARFTIKSHLAKHREAHNDFLRASQHIDYVTPNESTRVQRLLRSIQCKDGTILSAKTTIMADAVKKGDFEQAADFLLLVAPASISRGKEHNISALKRKLDQLSKQGGGKGGGDKKVRYYSKAEWWKLSQEDRNEITAKRKLVNKGKGSAGAQDTKIAALEQALEEQKQIIASMVSKPEPPLPPKGRKDPLQPPTGFTQRE